MCVPVWKDEFELNLESKGSLALRITMTRFRTFDLYRVQVCLI